MTFDEINDRIAERQHEFGGPTQRERDWAKFVRDVRKALGLNSLDGDQDADGYSLDRAHDYFADGCDVEDAAGEFRVSIADAQRLGRSKHYANLYAQAERISARTTTDLTGDERAVFFALAVAIHYEFEQMIRDGHVRAAA
jgi:hypothetical protein